MNEQTDAANDTTKAEFTSAVVRLSSPRGLVQWARIVQFIKNATETSVSIIFLLALLAVAASIPVCNILTLGYLLEAQTRVAKSGKFRSGFLLLPEAKRLGTILVGISLWLVPVQLVAKVARDSRLLAGESYISLFWTSLVAVTAVIVAIHLVMAIGCGGRWWQFFRPVRNSRWLLSEIRGGDYWKESHQAIIQFIDGFRIPHLAKLGLLGYAAVYVWLTIPAYLFTQLEDVTSRWQISGFVIGCVMLTLLLMWLPMLLVHISINERVSAIFEFSTVRALTQRVPLRWAWTTALLFGLSILPLLYVALLKARIPPHSIQWDMMFVFLVTAIPARLLIGLVYFHAARKQSDLRETNALHVPSFRWRLLYYANVACLFAAVGGYVYFLYLAETAGELGQRSVWQFHALLLPFPFR